PPPTLHTTPPLPPPPPPLSLCFVSLSLSILSDRVQRPLRKGALASPPSRMTKPQSGQREQDGTTARGEGGRETDRERERERERGEREKRSERKKGGGGRARERLTSKSVRVSAVMRDETRLFLCLFVFVCVSGSV